MTKLIVTRTANGNRTCYHTNEDCRYLNGTDYRPVGDNEIDFFGLHECKSCAGEIQNNGGKDSKFANFRHEAHEL